MEIVTKSEYIMQCADTIRNIFNPIEQMLPNGKIDLYHSGSHDALEIRISFDRDKHPMYLTNYICYETFKDISYIEHHYEQTLKNLEHDIKPYMKRKEYRNDFQELLK